MDEVVLVDQNDNEIGRMEKLQAHREGVLHRAFSILIFNSNGDWLIHKRAKDKYHSSGLWTNSCCSHPRPDEDLLDACNRRLNEEIGLVSDLNFAYNFIYKTNFENGLMEHELDHVFIGETDDKPILNPNEVEAFRYVDSITLSNEIKLHPEKFTIWFRLIFDHVMKNRNENG